MSSEETNAAAAAFDYLDGIGIGDKVRIDLSGNSGYWDESHCLHNKTGTVVSINKSRAEFPFRVEVDLGDVDGVSSLYFASSELWKIPEEFQPGDRVRYIGDATVEWQNDASVCASFDGRGEIFGSPLEFSLIERAATEDSEDSEVDEFDNVSSFNYDTMSVTVDLTLETEEWMAFIRVLCANDWKPSQLIKTAVQIYLDENDLPD